MFPYLVLLRVGFTLPRLLPVARCALTAPFHPYLCPKAIGGMFSAALSVGSRPPGITWHPALWSPDFPPWRKRHSGCPAGFGAIIGDTDRIRRKNPAIHPEWRPTTLSGIPRNRQRRVLAPWARRYVILPSHLLSGLLRSRNIRKGWRRAPILFRSLSNPLCFGSSNKPRLRVAQARLR